MRLNIFKRKMKIFIRKIFKNSSSKNESNDKVSLNSYPSFNSSVEFSNSEIGKYSYISPNSMVSSCQIGKFCSIGPQTIIGYGDHPIMFLSTSPIFYYGTQKFDVKIADKDYFEHHKRVIIKNDVWIGANVYIKNGVTIGNGAVIAAGAVVVNDVPDYAIVGGVPGKVIKYRFDEETIKLLLKIKWWDWERETIIKNHKLFVNPNFKEFLNENLGKESRNKL